MKHTRLLFSLFAMMVSLCSWCYDFEKDGIYYTIKSQSDRTVYVSRGLEYRGAYQGDIIIPENVFFQGISYVVTGIDVNAFNYCRGLHSISLPNSIIEISEYAFSNCHQLTINELPESLESLGDAAITGGCKINIHTMPKTLKYIGSNDLTDTEWYKNQPDGIVYINNIAYKYKGNPTTNRISIKSGTTLIASGAFSSCQGVTDFDIPSSIMYVGSNSFEKTEWYNNQPDGLVYIGNCLYKYKGELESEEDIYVMEGTKSISDNAFRECEKLKNITLPSSLLYIGDNAFEGCGQLKSLDIPDEVKHIGAFCFRGCGLESIKLPASLETYGRWFFDCESLKYIDVDRFNPMFQSLEGVLFTKEGNKLLAFPRNREGSYTIPEGVKYIGEFAFDGSLLHTVNFPDGIVNIGDYAFDGATNLIQIQLPQSVNNISQSSFSGCTQLQKVGLGENTKFIGYHAFDNCEKLSIIDGIDNIEYVSGFAFNNTPWYNNQPDGLMYIGNCLYAYKGTVPKGTTIDIKEGTTAISSWALGNISFVNLPQTLERIGTESLSTITDIDLPANIKYIGCRCFPNIEKITCRSSKVPSFAFYDTFKNYDATLYVPKESLELYKSTYPWSEFKNIRYIGQSDTYILYDGDKYELAKKQTVDELEYRRTFSNSKWQALYVPFSMSYDDWKNDFEVGKINDVNMYDTNDDGEPEVIEVELFKVKNGCLKPNTPYFIRAKGAGEKTITVTNATLSPAEENSIDCSSTEMKYTFTGTYSGISGSEMYANNYYALSGGSLCLASNSNVNLKPFRWYMKAESRGSLVTCTSAEIRIRVVGEDEAATSILSMETDAAMEVKTYTLDGRSINGESLKPGLYIQNGKKVIIK